MLRCSTPNAADSQRPASTARMSRRECMLSLAGWGVGSCAAAALGRPLLAADEPGLTEAMYYTRLDGGRTQCQLCPNRCIRSRGENGRCRARGNRNGRYWSLVYGRPCVVALDPLEKCPLYHFRIAGKAFSIATAGCNLTCSYCQNWMFSQAGPDDVPRDYDLSPQATLAKAIETGAGAVAFFYTEPIVYYEYMLAVAKQARRAGLKVVMVTAGYVNPEPLSELLPWLDAVTLGLKGWNEEFYRQYIGGELRYVKQTVEMLAAWKTGWWEVVHLVVPSLNDDMAEIAAMAAWLREVAGPERPLHFTRFRPEYRLKRLPMTPAATLGAARDAAMARGLKHVYVGNLPGHEGAHTYCPHCGRRVVERLAFTVMNQELRGGKCRSCGYPIGGHWL